MQDDTILQFANPKMQFLKRHYRKYIIISCHFLKFAHQSQLITNLTCNFSIGGYLKNVIELKTRITHRVNNVTPETLRCIVEYAVYRFKFVDRILNLSSAWLAIINRCFYSCFLCWSWPKDSLNRIIL